MIMVKFPHDKYKKKNGVSCIKDADIEIYAELVLADYNRELLDKPQPMPWSDFLETYLERDIQFANIHCEDFGEEILGTCSFDDNVPLTIYNDEKNCKESIELNTGDIVLNSLLESQKSRLLFTALHESGHWLLHQPYYFAKNPMKNQISLFGDEPKIIKCCRTADIEQSNNKRKLVTPEDFIEHQANVLAAALAVPRRTLRKLVHRLSKKYNYEMDKCGDELEICEKQNAIISEVANTFGVSKQVAKIRFEQLGDWHNMPDLLTENSS
jgi:Zn-dependent peptidase ImmA (M78 family)